MNATTFFVPLAFLLVFPVMWIGVVWLISRFGWAELANFWRTTETSTGMPFSSASGRIGGARYNHVLQIWLDDQGLFLEPIWLFRIGHERLLIPWEDVLSMKPSQILWQSGVRLELKNSKSFFLYGTVSTTLLELWSAKPVLE
jgi:hypothetical protein